jgi:hypothetical protein
MKTIKAFDSIRSYPPLSVANNVFNDLSAFRNAPFLIFPYALLIANSPGSA